MSERTSHVDLAEVLGALRSTSTEMTSMADRIAALEGSNQHLEDENAQLRQELSDMITTVDGALAISKELAHQADQAEADAAARQAHADGLHTDLSAAHGSLSQIAAAAFELAPINRSR